MVKKKNKTNMNIDEQFSNTKNAIKRSLKRYWGLVLKELKILVNDKIAMLIAYALPVTVIVLLATQGQSIVNQMQSTDRGSPPNDKPIIGVIDMDESSLSQEFMALIQDYEDTGYCILAFPEDTSSFEASHNEMLERLGRNEIHAILIIPPLFELNLTTHFPAILTVVFDTIDTNHLQNSETIIDKMIQEFKIIKGFTGVFQASFHSVGVPDKGRLLFLASPIFFPLILFAIGSLTATQSIVSDVPKDRMVLTPTNKYEMLAAKTTALQIIMTVLIIITVTLSMAFGMTIRGSVFGYFWLLFFMALSGVVWGLLVSAMADVPLNAFQYFIFMFLFQFIILIFVSNGFILRLIPIYNGRNLLLNVTLRGEPLAWNIQYLTDIIAEIIVLYLLTQWLFNRRKAML